MKKITSFLLVVALALTMTSCQQMKAKHQIKALESLVERVDANGENFTSQDWTDVSNEYDEICAKMDQYEYTPEQQKEISQLKGRFYAVCAKKAIKSAGGLFENIFEQASGIYQQASSVYEQASNTVEGFLDEMGDSIDEKLDELEDLFN